MSYNTYRRHGCRCPECTEAQRVEQRRLRAARDGALVKVDVLMRNMAASWVRTAHHDVWEDMRTAAYARLGIRQLRRGQR